MPIAGSIYLEYRNQRKATKTKNHEDYVGIMHTGKHTQVQIKP